MTEPKSTYATFAEAFADEDRGGRFKTGTVPPKDPEHDLSVWLNPDCHLPPPRWLEWEVFEEITQQSMHFLRRALSNTDDPRQALRVMMRAEKLIGQHVDAGFYLLETILESLQVHLYIAARMIRRHILRCALRWPHDEVYAREMQRVMRDDAEALEDARAAERHLSEGTRLMAGLWRSKTQAQQ
jgi:hypothetical protein